MTIVSILIIGLMFMYAAYNQYHKRTDDREINMPYIGKTTLNKVAGVLVLTSGIVCIFIFILIIFIYR